MSKDSSVLWHPLAWIWKILIHLSLRDVEIIALVHFKLIVVVNILHTSNNISLITEPHCDNSSVVQVMFVAAKQEAIARANTDPHLYIAVWRN